MNKFTPAGKVKQVKGSITAPENAGLRFVISTCSETGKFESKLQSILTKRWSKVKEDYRGWFVGQQNFKLGNVTTTAVSSDTWVVHLLCENKKGEVDQKGLAASVKKLADMAKYEKASIHVSKLISDTVPGLNDLLIKDLIEEGVNVYFYEEQVK